MERKRKRLVKLDTKEKLDEYYRKQEQRFAKSQRLKERSQEQLSSLEAEVSDAEVASESAASKKRKLSQQELDQKVREHHLDRKSNLRKIGLPNDYQFQSKAQLYRAVNALNNNTTISGVYRRTIEASARNAGVAVSNYRNQAADKTAIAEGYTAEDGVPARIKRRRELRDVKVKAAQKPRDKQNRGQQEEALALRLGFPDKAAYGTFNRNISSQRKSKRQGQSESEAVYQDKMSLYHEYPENSNVGIFLRKKPDGTKYRYMGTNLTRIANAAIEQTVPRRVAQSVMPWDQGGKRARYRAVVQQFRRLLEAENPEARRIHEAHPVHEVMARFDALRNIKRALQSSHDDGLRIR